MSSILIEFYLSSFLQKPTLFVSLFSFSSDDPDVLEWEVKSWRDADWVEKAECKKVVGWDEVEIQQNLFTKTTLIYNSTGMCWVLICIVIIFHKRWDL